MAPADNSQERPQPPFRRVTPGLPVGGRRDAEAPPQLPPASPSAEAPEAEPVLAPVDAAPVHPGGLPTESEPPKAVVVDSLAADLLPPVITRPLKDITGLATLLRGMAEGGEPLGPLVMPSRAEGAELEAPAAKKKRAKKGELVGATDAGGGDIDASERAWPSGPLVGRDLFTSNEVQRLVEAILMDEEILEHPTMPGLTRARLREVGHAAGFEANRFGRFSAALMVWFARAGVTVLEDDKARNEWARPRPIASRDRAEIRRMLRAVDPPDGDAVAIARAAGLDSTAP